MLLKNNLLNIILEFDQWLFLKINRDWTNPVLDAIFPVWRQSDTWIPLYFFLLVFMLLNFGWRSIFWILFVGITAGICDQVSSTLVKEFFDRVRPCTEPALAGKMHLLLNTCPSSGSFTSSHATNHFGIAMFIYLTTKDVMGKWGKLFFLWAATICYGQLYVGVHYPLDVIGGAVLGSGIGYAMAFIFKSQPMFRYQITKQHV